MPNYINSNVKTKEKLKEIDKMIFIGDFKELVLALPHKKQEELAKNLGWTLDIFYDKLRMNRILSLQKLKILFEYFDFKGKLDFYERKLNVIDEMRLGYHYIQYTTHNPLFDDIDKNKFFSLVKQNVTEDEYIIAYLLFGGYKGRYYKSEKISKELDIDKDYIQYVYKNILKKYTNLFIEENINNDDKYTLSSKKLSDIKFNSNESLDLGYTVHNPLFDDIDKNKFFSLVKQNVTEEEYIIVYLLFGGYKGRYYESEKISKVLDIDKDYILQICIKCLNEYKNLYIDLDNINNDDIDVTINKTYTLDEKIKSNTEKGES